MKSRKSDTWLGGTFKLGAGALSAGAALVSILSYTSAYSPLSTIQAHRLAVTPVRDTATSIGDTLQLAAIATDDRGAALSGVTPSWTSADPQVASVDQAGTVVSRGPGATAIIVRVGEREARARIAVVQRGAALTVTDSVLRVPEGERRQATLRVDDARGRAIRGATVRWEAGDGAVATVDSAGEVSGVSPGRSTLTATFDQLRATLPVEVVPVPASMTVVAGEDQRAAAGKPLGAPVSAQVVSRTGRPVEGVPVSLVLRSGQGSVQPEVDTSDARGMVQATWTLGSVPGRQQLALQVEGVAVSPVLTAEADPVPANTRVALVGDTLSAPVGDSLEGPLTIRVTDSLGLALADVPVAWSTPDGGVVAALGARTDSVGEARATWILGPKAGRQRARLQVGNPRLMPPSTVHAIARPGVAVSVAVRSGDRQSGTVGKPLSQPLVVRALDRHGNAVPGSSILVASSLGRGADSVITTDPLGQSRIRWTLGQTAGVERLSVRVAGHEAVEVTARARAGNPASLRFITASATPTKASTRPVVVEVADANGNPVAGRTVTFSATRGTLSSARVVTNSSGRASVVWKVTGKASQGDLVAKVSGTEVRATLKGRPGPG